MFAAALPAISPQAVEFFFALAIGFAFAGSCANGYRLFGQHFPSLPAARRRGPGHATLCRDPAAAFAAPFIIMRATAYAGGASNAAVRTWSWWQR